MSNGIGRPGLLGSAAYVLLFCTVTQVAAQERGLAWGYNSFGIPGMIDMPTALGRQDAELAFNFSHFKNQSRNSLTFQISNRLSASFRYSKINHYNSPTGGALFDRSFSLQYRLLDEGRYLPAVAIGLNDMVGTGVYGGEYVVATKTLSPKFRASVGLGWGRLGSYKGFTNPLAVFNDSFRTRPKPNVGLGGTFDPKVWFKGDAAFFGGIEWRATDKLRVIAEYSSDAYALEDGNAFKRKSPFNFGVSYQYNDRTAIAANYLYGSEVGIQLTYALNPKRPRYGSGTDPAPPAIHRRTPGEKGLLVAQDDRFAARAADALMREGLSLDGVEASGKTLRIQIRNDRYSVASQAVGRAARILTQLAPPEVETFDIRLAVDGMPVTSVILRRSDLEDLEFHPVAPDLLRVNTQIVDAKDRLEPVAGRFPILTYGLAPYLAPSLFDPDSPLRLNVGVDLTARYEPSPGFVFSGKIRQKLAGNLNKSTRASSSVLPRVRSEANLYEKTNKAQISELTAAYYFRPGDDLFGRVTVGYLESMFGGISTELLWKPQNSRLALGAELNLVKQRNFDQLFGFRSYKVLTGHVSAYYDIGGGFQGQLDVGRYLAGDEGATFTLAREFDNGWRVGAFATLTNVSSKDFGEGSFDKGILVTIPLDWVTGKSSPTKLNQVIRSVQRDGGARLNVSGRLFETVRQQQATEIDATWGRFWR